MTFITGSVTNANPGPTLYALIETEMLTLGWTLEDTVVIGGNTHKVLKSAAAGNAYGKDFFLDINFPTTGITGGLRMAPFEGYTAGTDLGLRGPFSGTSSTTSAMDATTYSRYGATASALETNWNNSAGNTGVSAALSASAFGYWVSITRNRIVLLLSVTAAELLYSGFFTPVAAHIAHAGAALFPLIMVKLPASGIASSQTTQASCTAATTRIPKLTSIIGWANAVRVGGGDLTALAAGQVGTANSEFLGTTELVPVPVSFGVGSSLPTTALTVTAPGHVGDLDGVAVGWVIASAVRGDTVTIGADTWYAVTPNNNVAVFMKGV